MLLHYIKYILLHNESLKLETGAKLKNFFNKFCN